MGEWQHYKYNTDQTPKESRAVVKTTWDVVGRWGRQGQTVVNHVYGGFSAPKRKIKKRRNGSGLFAGLSVLQTELEENKFVNMSKPLC